MASAWHGIAQQKVSFHLPSLHLIPLKAKAHVARKGDDGRGEEEAEKQTMEQERFIYKLFIIKDIKKRNRWKSLSSFFKDINSTI